MLRVIGSPDQAAAVTKEELAASISDGSILPEAAVIIQSPAVIHQLRASSGGLTGATFLSPVELAGLVLLAHGESIVTLADRNIPAVIEAIISSPLFETRLEYFNINQIRTGAGYSEALASTICELGSAGLTPGDLLAAADRLISSASSSPRTKKLRAQSAARRGPELAAPQPQKKPDAQISSDAGLLTAARLRDIAAIWDALEAATSAHGRAPFCQILNSASAILSQDPSSYPYRGRTVVFFDEQTPNILLKFFGTIPRLTGVYFRAYPERKKLQNRIAYALGVLNLTEEYEKESPGSILGDAKSCPAAHSPPTQSTHSTLTFSSPAPQPLSAPGTEIDILKARLFHPLGEEVPFSSSGPDGTVHFEEHAGVEDELQAAVEWVSREVLDRGVPLERIAILLPDIDPYGFMLLERLSSLPFPTPLPVYVANGIPAKAQADGSRLIALLDALEAHLSADSLSRLLPYVRMSAESSASNDNSKDADRNLDGDIERRGKNKNELDVDKADTGPERRHLTFAESLELAYSCGTLGGLAGRPEAARQWAPAVERRITALRQTVREQKELGSDDPEESRHARDLDDNERLLANFEGIRPSLKALVEVHDLILNGASLDALWDALENFATTRILLPPAAPTPVLPALRNELGPLLLLSKAVPLRDPAQKFRLTGLPALRLIRKALDNTRLPVGRFGEPRIYIGTISSAAGLSFDAVRVLGLCESAWPSRPSVDPILPDIDRTQLEPLVSGRPDPARGPSPYTVDPPANKLVQDSESRDEACLIPRRDDEPLHQLCTFYRGVRGVRSRLVLSFARQSAEGTIKEPGSIYLEAATALRRPVGGKPTASIPSLTDLRLGYFIPGREAASNPPALSKFTLCSQVACRSSSLRPASPQAVLPASWRPSASSPTDLQRMRELILFYGSPVPSPQDGLLPPGWPLPRQPGLAAHSPTSSSRVKVFLTCPYAFLLRNILHWEEPPSAPDTREIGQPDYGSLLHRTVEAFFSPYGSDFTARRRTLEAWKKEARMIADREFAEFAQNYPLLSGRVCEQQRKRLTRDFLSLLEHEWKNRLGLEFRAAEFQFGFPDPVPLGLDARFFFVRGYIDRLDLSRGGILIRDVKSGKAVPREKDKSGPSPVVDAQLAVYALVMNSLHQISPRNWPRVGGAAYLYPDPRGVSERAFESDLNDLLKEGHRWLSLLADMIEGRAFPRTADAEDCRYCPFVPVCGDQAHGAAAMKLKNAGPLIQRFLSMKGVEEERVEEPEE